MRAAVVNPYFDTLGGGERYTVGVVQALLRYGYSVDIQWNDNELLQKIKDRFGIKLENVRIVEDLQRGDGYDLCFWISDGSIPLLRSRNNLLHFQVPFSKVNGKNVMNRMKLFRIKHVICNSEFTKKVIDKEFGVESKVLYPPVSTDKFSPKRKENLIIYVGRFSKLMQSKRQDVLINNFKKLVDNGLTDWKLALLGGSEVGGEESAIFLKKESEGYPIEVVENPPFRMLQQYYGSAKIYWSASGFGVNDSENPQSVEHFGITVVESMAAGCVPVVVNIGGHKEIIDDKQNGYLWDKESQLREITTMLISNKKELASKAKNAIKESNEFSDKSFVKNFELYL